MLLVLGGVIVVIYLFFFFLKKGMGRKLPDSDLIRVLGSSPLQGNNLLYLVQIGVNFYLIGVGANSPNLIAKIEDKETLDQLKLRASEKGSEENQNFSHILSRIFNTGKTDKNRARNPIDFMKSQQDRLKKL